MLGGDRATATTQAPAQQQAPPPLAPPLVSAVSLPPPATVAPGVVTVAVPATVASAGAGAGAGAGARAAIVPPRVTAPVAAMPAAVVPPTAPDAKRSRDMGTAAPVQSGNRRGNGKRARTHSPAPPSKVIFVRRLPPDTTEADVLALFNIVEPPRNILLLSGRHVAFVEMSSIDAAMAVLHMYSGARPQIRRWDVYLEYSRRDAITTQEQKQTPVLLITVSAAVFPTTIDTMFKILCQYGEVLRIIMFERTSVRFLCELNSAAAAHRALLALNGQYIYSGGANLMHVQFSSNTRLHVKYNNERMRDFTNPALPPGDAGGMGMRSYGGHAPPGMYPAGGGGITPHQGVGQIGRTWPGMDPMAVVSAEGGGLPPTTVLIVSEFDPDRVDCDTLFKLVGVYGDVMRVKILFAKPDTALVQLRNLESAACARKMLRDCPLYGRRLRVNFSKKLAVSASRDSSLLTKDYASSPHHRFVTPDSKNLRHRCPPSRVLHLANMSEAPTDEAELKAAFSKYGTVTKFKLFTTSKAMALIEMSSVTESVAALIGLHNSSVAAKSKGLKVSFSLATIL